MPTMDGRISSGELRGGSRRDPVWAILAGLALVLALTVWRVTSGAATKPIAPIQTCVNPNTAPWWELMALPDVGEATARGIVAYREVHRERTPVFRSAADLEPVPDIGPKTIARIAPHLCFDD